MRRVVRLTKKFSRSRNEDDPENWKEKMTSGICITKLVVDNYQHIENRDDEALYLTWTKIRDVLVSSLKVEHPIDPGKTLSKGDNDNEVKFFKEKITWALECLDALQNSSCDKKTALSKWDEVFNTDFFLSQLPPDDGSDDDKSKNPFYVDVKESTKRDDRGGRYGRYNQYVRGKIV